MAAPIYILTNSVQGLPFLQILADIVICRLFDDSHSDRCEVTSHGSFAGAAVLAGSADKSGS